MQACTRVCSLKWSSHASLQKSSPQLCTSAVHLPPKSTSCRTAVNNYMPYLLPGDQHADCLLYGYTIPSFRSEWKSLVPRLFVGERLGTRLQGEWYNFTTRTGNWSSVTSLKSKKSFGTRFSHHLSTSVFIWSLQSKHWHTIWSWENLLSTEKPLKEQLTLDEWRTLWSQHRQVHSVTASSYQQWCVKQLHYQQWCMKQLYLVAAETITEWETRA